MGRARESPLGLRRIHAPCQSPSRGSPLWIHNRRALKSSDPCTTGPGIFAIPNPWDAGSASILATLGFEALATTSAGFAFSVGRPDAEGAIGREETLANARAIVDATSLPVSADLENGFGDDPDACAETIRQAAAVGLVGGSIEDATGRAGDPIYAYDLSIQRVQAAVKAARSLRFPFVLTARAENLINGRPDLPDTIRRLVAFAEAGADALYAPGLKTREEIDAVVRAVAPKPVNVVMGLSGPSFSARRARKPGRETGEPGLVVRARRLWRVPSGRARGQARKAPSTSPALPSPTPKSTRCSSAEPLAPLASAALPHARAAPLQPADRDHQQQRDRDQHRGGGRDGEADVVVDAGEHLPRERTLARPRHQ